MNTYVLLFSVYSYSRNDLEKMTASELYELASAASTVGYDEAAVLPADEFSQRANDDEINLNNVWVYAVTI